MAVVDLLRPVSFPDIAPIDILGLESPPDFSMCAGEFLEAYANDRGMSDYLNRMIIH